VKFGKHWPIRWTECGKDGKEQKWVTWPLLQFRNLFHTDGRTPWASDQPVLRPLPRHRSTQTQNKRTHKYPCLWVGFEPTIPAFERVKTVHALDGAVEVSGQLHAPAALSPGKSPRYPFYRRLGGPQSRSGRYGEVKIFYPTGTRTPAPPHRASSPKPVAIPTELSRLPEWVSNHVEVRTSSSPLYATCRRHPHVISLHHD
jgi:hypothetical protein